MRNPTSSPIQLSAWRYLIVLSFSALFVQCDCNKDEKSACSTRCSAGFECDESLKLCISNQLDLYKATMPGRSVAAVALDRGVLIAAIDPERRAVVLQDNDAAPRLLATDIRPGIARLAMARRGDRVIMSWVNRDGFYTVAEHVGADFSRQWTTQTIAPQNEQEVMDYQATRDFDIALSTDGKAHMVFRDGKTGTLFHLERALETNTWSHAQIDDGQRALTPDPCPLETRTRKGKGVGVEPDLISAESGGLFVAYHDADCGDLRIARRGNTEWVVGMVDQGEKLNSASAQRSVTGRWPSIAIRTDGVLGISYQDLTLGQLMYAESNSDGFRREVVDEGIGFDLFSKKPKKIVGAYSTLSFDAQNTPLITYFDGTQTALLTARLSQRDPRQWTIRTRKSEGLTGFFGAHVRRADGLIHFVCEQLLPIDGTVSSLLISFEEEE